MHFVIGMHRYFFAKSIYKIQFLAENFAKTVMLSE